MEKTGSYMQEDHIQNITKKVTIVDQNRQNKNI